MFDPDEVREDHDRSLQALREMNLRQEVLGDLAKERLAQIVKWGHQVHDDGTSEKNFSAMREYQRALCDARAANGVDSWLDILMEEVYEAAAEEDVTKLDAELRQVGAVVVAWLEAIRSR